MSPQPARRDDSGLLTLRGIDALRREVGGWRRAGESVGLVPTMGALHAGHLALVRQAKVDCDRVVASLFVNPIQFDRKGDLASYPRDEARDAAALAALGVDLLYAPAAEEIYPEGFATTVSVTGLIDCLCGATRPGHLTGVSTVVTKLLLQSLPDVAYFGEKDYQQLLVVRRAARDLDIQVEIAAVPTVREADGLALSSRNETLTPDQRARAPALYRVLTDLAGRLAGGGAAEPELAWGRAELAAAGFEGIDYLDLRHGETLETLERATPPARLFVAAFLGEVRLIDNLAVF
jgi:pantoate--beta-alanine ligase